MFVADAGVCCPKCKPHQESGNSHNAIATVNVLSSTLIDGISVLVLGRINTS